MSSDILFQIVVVVFALGLAIRYLLMDSEDRIYDHIEHKQTLTSSEHKAFFTVGLTDQVEGSEQTRSRQETNKQGPSALFLKNKHDKSTVSKKVTRPRSDFSCLPSLESVDEAFEKDSTGVDVKKKVLERRRTVSEGDCANDCQMSEDNQHPQGLMRLESSPPRMEHKERSLEECKLKLKQSVCCILLYITGLK